MKSPIKVLHLLHDSRRSGVPAVAANLLMALDRSEIVPMALFAYDGAYVRLLNENNVAARAFTGRRPFIWRVNRFLFNALLPGLAREVDLIHIHSVKLALSVLVAKWSGMRVVYHLHELPDRVGPLLKKAMSLADCVLFCSRSCEAHFASVPVKSGRTIVNAMSFPSAPPVQHRGKSGKVVMIGSINGNKGQDILLKAFARMENRDAELWLYGTTGLSAHRYVSDLKRFAERHGLSGRVFFPGPTSDVFRVFAGASLVVHTSWSESFGMALVEAMSCGVPVIAHDLGGMREVVVDGVNGYLVKPGDIDALAARMDELLADPGLRAQMGEAGYRMVRERFDVASRLDAYMELYREILNR
jgi:glycosyltransferase involved in cell wall biosynthesis